MSTRQIRWSASPELAALLRRYYAGEAELWGAVQAIVHQELMDRGLAVFPRHLRFRRLESGYEVMIEDAEEYLTGL
ncbi:MAG: hypothetical protein N2378_02375 [Chloroflexaceae bacterium]|nr:hypothetical protein [Chloroflexaceae bacterium]